MVGVINPNSTQTLDAQIDAARSADFQVVPGEPIPKEATSTLANVPTSTSLTGASDSGSGSPKLSGGAIAGIVIGGVAFLVICAALFFFVGRSRSLKEVLKRQDVAGTPAPHMSQYGVGGLQSPGYSSSGFPSPAPYQSPGPGDYGFNSPPHYGQHSVGEQYPSGWASPQQHMSGIGGLSQQQ